MREEVGTMRIKIMIGTTLSFILVVLVPSVSAIEYKTTKETYKPFILEKLKTSSVRDMKNMNCGIWARIILYTLYCIIIQILATYLGQTLDKGE